MHGFGYLQPSRITSPDSFTHVKYAADWFAQDVDSDALTLEMQFIRSSNLIKEIIEKAVQEERKPSLLHLYRALLKECECFLNLSKLVKIALTVPLTSVSAERSFWKLKIIKNRLRTTIGQDRLQ